MPIVVTNFFMGPTVRHYYNVGFGVGHNRRNNPLDVLLVQFFLNLLKGTVGGQWLGTPLAIDGLCRDLTEDAIRRFQSSWNRIHGHHKPRLDEDAIVSPARGAWRPVPNKTWTIVALNALVGNETSGVGPDMYCRLDTHPRCPPPLRAFFVAAPKRLVP
jgi:hypothetical protein